MEFISSPVDGNDRNLLQFDLMMIAILSGCFVVLAAVIIFAVKRMGEKKESSLKAELSAQSKRVDWERSPNFKKIQFCLGEMIATLKNARYRDFNAALAEQLRCCMNYRYLWDIGFTPYALEHGLPQNLPPNAQVYLPEKAFRDRWVNQWITFLSHAPGTEKGLSPAQKSAVAHTLQQITKTLEGFRSFEELYFFRQDPNQVVDAMANDLSLSRLKQIFERIG